MMKTIHYSLALVILGLIALGAGGASSRTPDKYHPAIVKSGGTIVGVVKFKGAPPPPKRVEVATKEEVCHQDEILSEKLVVSKDHQVRWAVISLKNITAGKPFPKPEKPEDRPTLDQSGCTFKPHVVVVPRGKPLTVLNSDGVLHNVHTWPRKNRAKNMAMPGVIKEMKLKFRRPETLRVSCDIHPWMEAWIVIVEHPYHAVSDEKGAFKLTDVPPGTYVLQAWHEQLGNLEQEITVRAGKETAVEFVLSEK